MAYDEEVFGVGAVVQEFVEVLEGGGGGEGVGVEDLGLVAGLGSDQGGGLEGALERAGDDEIELNVESIEDTCELEAVALTFFVEWTLEIEERIGAAGASTGVA